MLSDRVRRVLPRGTAVAWERVASIVPSSAYLVGGTGLAVHLQHRISRDLDLFLEERVDIQALVAALEGCGRFVMTMREDEPLQTLSGVLGSTKLQFLEATSQRLIEEPAPVGGLRVAGVADLLATKLNVITHRPALRDYLDLMEIERKGGLRVEEGLALVVEKYRPTVPEQTVRIVVECLAHLDDVPEEPDLVFPPGAHSVTRGEVVRYWRRRVPEVVAHLGWTDVTRSAGPD